MHHPISRGHSKPSSSVPPRPPCEELPKLWLLCTPGDGCPAEGDESTDRADCARCCWRCCCCSCRRSSTRSCRSSSWRLSSKTPSSALPVSFGFFGGARLPAPGLRDVADSRRAVSPTHVDGDRDFVPWLLLPKVVVVVVAVVLRSVPTGAYTPAFFRRLRALEASSSAFGRGSCCSAGGAAAVFWRPARAIGSGVGAAAANQSDARQSYALGRSSARGASIARMSARALPDTCAQ
mmetsp:Transcript_10241/g.31630  ORF Transcript_10241/g.31630 Transcript_10241/m.31630 type:complete len:236 (-) Transcript_10241:1516-2223(-)